MDQRLEKLEARIAEIEGRLKDPATTPPDSGQYTAEPEPEYRIEKKRKVLFVENIAAGPPINQSDDLSNYTSVSSSYIKTGRPEDYYAARIQGESMTAAGIPDDCMVLIRKSDVPKTGAIQVVRHGGKSTLKRMREDEDHHWTLYYDDGTNRYITIESEDYQVQGDFVMVLPEA